MERVFRPGQQDDFYCPEVELLWIIRFLYVQTGRQWSQWRWKSPGLVSSWNGFLINEDNPMFDAYLAGDLPVFC